MRYYINIGSNMGHRYANINTGIEALERAVGPVAMRSGYIVTPAWGFESNNDFVNMAVAIDSHLEPQQMLSTLKSIEDEVGTSVHRNSAGDYCDRIIDLDIMAIDQMVVDEPNLQVPHKHMHRRDFFLKPMQQLCPEWQHPVLNLNLDEMLCQLQEEGKI